MRKLVYDVATTLDHFIAHEDGSLDGFLFDGEHVPEYLARLAGYDTVVMGTTLVSCLVNGCHCTAT